MWGLVDVPSRRFGMARRAASADRGRRAFLLSATGALCLVTRSGVSTWARGPLLINASQVPPFHTPDGKGFEDRLAIEVYRRLGLAVRIHDVPAERGLQLLDQGIDDGTLARNPGMSRLYPNLVSFTEKALDREYVAFNRGEALSVSGWQSLAPYHVGIVRGWKILERNIGQSASLIEVADGEQLFRLLASGRIDVAVFNKWGGLYLIKTLGLSGVRLVGPPFARRSVFFYLHKRYSDLVEPASEALREVKRDGTYDRLVAEILMPLQG